MKVLDPTAEASPATRIMALRQPNLAGSRVALLDINKPRGDVFLDHLERLLSARGLRVTRYAKPTFTKPAPIDLRHQIATESDAVIEALAD
jgi:hypothetical protein